MGVVKAGTKKERGMTNSGSARAEATGRLTASRTESGGGGAKDYSESGSKC